MCEVPTYKQPGTNATTDTVYALKAVSVIPFFDVNEMEESKDSSKCDLRHDAEKIADVIEKITEYLTEGFYFA